MKTKKILSFILTLVLLSGILSVFSVATEGPLPLSAGLEKLETQFKGGIGPETEGFTIDYRYYSPVNAQDSTKYPLVIWLHGMGDGSYEGEQIKENGIGYWTSAEFQARFRGSEGAFIFVPRSVEEQKLYWDTCLIHPLRAAIDSFISINKNNIDTTRIYIGGYSMGGKMTFRMAIAYPDMFAAAFPVCPAWTPSADQLKIISDVPVWMTSGVLDPLVNYTTSIVPIWKSIRETTTIPADCRFTTIGITRLPNGRLTSNQHRSWSTVTHDMFTEKGDVFPTATTKDANNNTIELKYPDGMISWLSSHHSDYDGSGATDEGTDEAYNSGRKEFITDLFKRITDFFKMLFGRLFGR